MYKIRLYLCILIVSACCGVASAQTPDFTGLKVMLNPGHGGHDSDDRGMPNGFWESDGNLTKGLWLRDLLEARQCTVIMSRVTNFTEDDLPLSTIAAIANQNNVDLFLSIHSNAANQSVNYPMTIFNGKSESPSIPEAKEWAIVLWEHLVSNMATYWTNTDPHYIGDLTLNPTWSYGYGVLYPLTVPGIISEGSFHDYSPEVDRLLNLDYRKQEAWNMLYAMIDYFELAGTEALGNISGIIRDTLLSKENYSNPEAADYYHNVNGALVELMETGESYQVDTLNTGFYMFDSITPGSYHLLFSAQDYFNDTIEVEVVANQFSYVNEWLEADKTMAPKLIGFKPAEGALTPCFDPVSLTFNMNMDSATLANAFSIEPAISGSFSWDKNYLQVTFQPHIPYDTETTYTVTIAESAEHQWGVPMGIEHSFTFVTDSRNRYLLESSFPIADQQEISPYLQFRLIFDAPLNNTSLIGAVKIEATDATQISTSGAYIETLEGKGHYYFTPETPLKYNANYTLKLAGTIQDDNSIPMVEATELSFTTMIDPGDSIVLDEMENLDDWNLNLAESQGIDGQSFLYRWSKEYLSGSAAILFRYVFLSNDAICMIRPSSPLNLDNRFSEVGLWIWGEMGQHKLYLGFDNDEEKELCNVDFAGWAYRKMEIPTGATALTYIKMLRVAEGAEGGDLIFDMLHQPGSTVGIHVSSMEHIRAYPNPIKDESIHISGMEGSAFAYSIYSITGQLLQNGNVGLDSKTIKLNETSMNQSMVLLKIKNKDVSFSTMLNVTR